MIAGVADECQMVDAAEVIVIGLMAMATVLAQVSRRLGRPGRRLDAVTSPTIARSRRKVAP